MNVLLTCAGRRTAIISAFQDALRGEGLVLACDTDADAPAMQQADRAFLVPPVEHEDYVGALLSICERQRAGLLIPALEPELPRLARHRSRFTDIGTRPMISTLEVINRCHDKLEAARLLHSWGLQAPRSFVELEAVREALAKGEISFPLILKPRWGVSSIGLQMVEDREELELAFRLSRKQIPRTVLAGASAADLDRCILVQERLPGDEYGLEVINDLEGRYACTYVKRKLRMRNGQTDRAMSVFDPRLEAVGRTIGERLGHMGMLDCDVFAAGDQVRVIDLNPRVGAAYPFSHAAGANFPAALIAWARGQTPDPRWLRVEPGVTVSKGEQFFAKHPSGGVKNEYIGSPQRDASPVHQQPA
jgi:carbamoyl-phosphate synthase large subunit